MFSFPTQIGEKENKSANLKAEERLEFLKLQEQWKEEEERILEELRKLNSPTISEPTVCHRCIVISSFNLGSSN